ncbi:MAG: BRCT domain-containing protein [Planctomycetota bacterium]|jgi:hypothetical protein
MPAGKRQQGTNLMLGALILVIFLFVAALVAAIVLYMQFENQRVIAKDATTKLETYANSRQQGQLPTMFGATPRGKTVIGTMLEYVDEMAYTILGGPVEDTSSEVKVQKVKDKMKEVFHTLEQGYIDLKADDPNSTGLVRIVEKLKVKIDTLQAAYDNENTLLEQLQNRFDDAMAANFEKEQTLLAEKEEFAGMVNEIRTKYDGLKELTKKTSDDRVKVLMDDLDKAEAKYNQLYKDSLKNKAELDGAQTRVADLQRQIDKYVKPDSAIAAYQADGKVILIDIQHQIVHLSLGTDDGLYRGLAFTVYDKNLPIPGDGKGKAEVEVFDVQKNISVAKIIPSVNSRPILKEDKIANLIWDAKKANVFVVTGEFDIDGNGSIDYNSGNKIKDKILLWGGQVHDNVTIKTDYVVIGEKPVALTKPRYEEMEVDPLAMKKYEDSIKEIQHYEDIQRQAEILSIPVFNLDRFLYFIGCKSIVDRTGSF